MSKRPLFLKHPSRRESEPSARSRLARDLSQGDAAKADVLLALPLFNVARRGKDALGVAT